MLIVFFSIFIVALLNLSIAFFKPGLFEGLFGEYLTKTKALSVFAALLLLALLGFVFNLESSGSANTGRVVRVIDGDTVELVSGARVRLIGIDAPEIGKKYAKEAKKELATLILGKKVTLERDTSNTDKYGRLLRYIWHADTLINEVMVRRGFAYDKSYPPDIKYQKRLRAAETKAKETRRGLWLDK